MTLWIAYFTGLVLSLMVYFNGQLSAVTSTYISNIVYHGIGFLFFGIMVFVFRKQTPKVAYKWVFLIPGVMGSLTIILNNYVMSQIGVTLMVAFTLLGQVVTSLIIDHFGLLGKDASKTHTKQWLGVAIMSVGLWIMIF
ncbi:DMT family transporter [Fusibacter tunisiensis]|uniref:Transporter family-2 protein n=1 Tax=Fusibacter tunisiensis TaxID=1008308 RepID=A0ABS2MTG5_9FIRM|nr:DMT family transporter [Fusibacter tunisiensis]MBM7562680.1 transporter family-2 protein [Fusibacter tunisiensis]